MQFLTQLQRCRLSILRQEVVRSLRVQVIDVKQVVCATQFLDASAVVDRYFLQDPDRWIKHEPVDARNRHRLVRIVECCQTSLLHYLRFVEVQTLLSDIQFNQPSVLCFLIFKSVQFVLVETIHIANVLANGFRIESESEHDLLQLAIMADNFTNARVLTHL